MDQLIFSSLPHTHYWYEVDVLKVPAIKVTRTEIFPYIKKNIYIYMPNKWRTINLLVDKIRLHDRRGKGMAESFSREKFRQAPQKEDGEILRQAPQKEGGEIL